MTPLEIAILRILERDYDTPAQRILDIMTLLDEHYHDRINKLAEKLDERTTELQRLQRLVGDEA
jgi:hypothetical protein